MIRIIRNLLSLRTFANFLMNFKRFDNTWFDEVALVNILHIVCTTRSSTCSELIPLFHLACAAAVLKIIPNLFNFKIKHPIHVGTRGGIKA